jgi:uncharacterized protein
MSFDAYTIPFDGKYIVYRPRRQLAFVANAAMVNAVASFRNGGCCRQPEAQQFLQDLGFLEDDPEELLSSPGSEPYLPTTAVLLLTTVCTLRCVYCYAHGGETAAETMPVDLGRRAIDTVVANAVDRGLQGFSVSFHGGGEPTAVDSALRELVTYARSRQLPCQLSLTSNGVWTERQRGWIPGAFDTVSLSCDGLPAVHDRQRPRASGSGSSRTVLAAARALDDQGTPYGIRLTVLDDGLDDLVAGVRFLCATTSCRTFQVEPAFDHGRAHASGLALGRADCFAAALTEAERVARAEGRQLYYSGARPWTLTDRFCRAPDEALAVTPSGRLTACYEVCREDHPLARELMIGDLGPDGPPAVDGAARRRLLGRLEERRRGCRDCFCYWHCAGDCAAKVLSPDRDGHLHYGARCELNRAVTRQLLIGLVTRNNGVWQGGRAGGSLLEPCDACW